MKRDITLLLLLLLLLGCGDEKSEIKKVKVSTIGKNIIGNGNTYIGQVFPGDRSQLLSYSPGVVEAVYVRVGDEVKVGDLLFTYKTNTIKLNEAKLLEAKLELEILKKDLLNYDIEKKESALKGRELEKKFLDYEIKTTTEQLFVLSSEIKSAKKIVNLYKGFLKEESISIFELNTQENNLLKKESEYESLKLKLELDKQKYSLLELTETRLEKELQYQEEKLKAKYEKQKKDVDIYERALLESLQGVKASKDGILTKFDVFPDEKLERLQGVGVISSNENLRVSIKVPIFEASKIKVGQKSKMEFSDFNGVNKYTGKVSRISNFVTKNEEKLGIDVEVEIISGKLKKLKPGYKIQTKILNSNQSNCLTVNKFSVIDEAEKKYVYSLENGKAIKKEIIIGEIGENFYEVLNLEEGTKIILNPFVITEGDRVEEMKQDV